MKLNKSLLVLAATAALAGCYVPSAPDEVLYGQVVSTAYKQDKTTGQPDPLFASTTDVVLESTIAIIDDTSSGVSVSQSVQDGVVEQIRKNLSDRGYTVTLRNPSDPEPPEGTFRVGAYALFGSVALFYSDYWCSWYYYYYCYPTTSYAGSYQYGTLLTEAGLNLYTPGKPPATVPPGGDPPASTLVWTNAIYGVLAGGSTITTASPGYQKALGSIDQAFAQSPYFRSQP
jgi:hypothetical protein